MQPSTLKTSLDIKSKEQLRRKSHSAIEKRRRERINDQIKHLKVIVPNCKFSTNSSVHKLTVLENTIDYIMQLQQTIARMYSMDSVSEDSSQSGNINQSTSNSACINQNTSNSARINQNTSNSACSNQSTSQCASINQSTSNSACSNQSTSNSARINTRYNSINSLTHHHLDNIPSPVNVFYNSYLKSRSLDTVNNRPNDSPVSPMSISNGYWSSVQFNLENNEMTNDTIKESDQVEKVDKLMILSMTAGNLSAMNIENIGS